MDADTQTELDAGRSNDRYMVLFDFASGFYGFWGGLGPFDHNSITYVGAGSLISAEDLDQGIDGEAIPLVLTLTGIPNSDLSPDVLASIEAETYHQRPVVVSTAYFDANDALLSVETEYRGYIDQIRHSIQPGGEAKLTVHCESRARDALRIGYRMRSDSDQRLIDADDGGLRHAIATPHARSNWGRQTGRNVQEVTGGLFPRIRAWIAARRGG